MKFVYILIAILILLIMITIHEFGHYVVGKIFKFKINEFAIGMGPAIYKRKCKNGEVFSIRAFPLGGFCAFEGEDEDNENPNAFNNKKPWQRILVLVAGATMNFILALLIIIIMFSCYGRNVINVSNVTNSTSYQYSLQDGDTLLKINNRNLFTIKDYYEALNGKKKGNKVKVKVLRNNKVETQVVELRYDVNVKDYSSEQVKLLKALGAEEGYLRVYDSSNEKLKNKDYFLYYAPDKNSTNLTKINSEKQLIEALIDAFNMSNSAQFYFLEKGQTEARAEDVPIIATTPANWEEIVEGDLNTLINSSEDYQSLKKELFGAKMDLYLCVDYVSYKAPFFQRIGEGFIYSFKLGGLILETLGELLTGKLGLNAVGGPITTIKTTSEIASYGFEYILEIMALIGVNLAVFNLLPIPALDGSRVVFTAIEWIFKKPVPKKIEGVIHAVGLILLLGFSILVDVLQFF